MGGNQYRRSREPVEGTRVAHDLGSVGRWLRGRSAAPLEREGRSRGSAAPGSGRGDNELMRRVDEARARASSAAPSLEERVAGLERHLTALQRELAERESAQSYTVELFITLAAGAITAPLGALAVGEPAPEELLKAVVSGAAGGGILIVVFFAGRMVESHFLDPRDHPAP